MIREEFFVPACDHPIHLTRSHKQVAKGRTHTGKGLSSHSNRPQHKKSHQG